MIYIPVSIRGTFHVRDAMVDLLGRNVPFYVSIYPKVTNKDGLAHEGILTTARKKHELLEPIIEEAIQVEIVVCEMMFLETSRLHSYSGRT